MNTPLERSVLEVRPACDPTVRCAFGSIVSAGSWSSTTTPG